MRIVLCAILLLGTVCPCAADIDNAMNAQQFGVPDPTGAQALEAGASGPPWMLFMMGLCLVIFIGGVNDSHYLAHLKRLKLLRKSRPDFFGREIRSEKGEKLSRRYPKMCQIMRIVDLT